MSALGLGDYASSDEDETEDVAPALELTAQATRPSKHVNTEVPSEADIKGSLQYANEHTGQSMNGPTSRIGPTMPGHEDDMALDEDSNNEHPPLSPYSRERQQVRSLTMPPIPNFDIPPSPSPTPSDDADLEASSNKIAHFAELKHKGIHYNDKLLSASAFKNPAITEKLLAFAGIQGADQYRSSLPEGLGVDVDYWASQRVEEVVSKIEARRKAEAGKAKGSKREFVSGGRLA